MTTLLAWNRRSRCGDIDPDRFVDILSPLGSVMLHDLVGGAPLERVVERLGDDLERLVVGGGDGTFNRSLPAILAAGRPVGILPLGTANDFARTLQLPLDPDDALRAVLEGRTRKVDIGRANGVPFLNAVSVGIGPELNKELDAERKRRLGVFAYLATLIGTLKREHAHLAEFALDGERRKIRFTQVTVANGRHYGGGLTVAEGADLDDGLLHLLWLQPQSKLRMLRHAAALRWGAGHRGGQPPGLRVFTAREIGIETGDPLDVTADGELVTKTPLTCTIVREAFEVYVPAGSAGEAVPDG